MQFEPFPKISRLSRDMIITEKLDGTNAQIYIRGEHSYENDEVFEQEYDVAVQINDKDEPLWIRAGSRNRWLSPTKAGDNFGFATWVRENASELSKLGPGRHYGEWYGRGIQRGYDLNERRFSLFNVGRWIDPKTEPGAPVYGNEMAPSCCSVVPVILKAPFITGNVERAMNVLEFGGSLAVPGYMKPEGIVIFHTQNGVLFKKTFEGDEVGKGI